MNQEIQELSIEEIELITGGGIENDPPTAMWIEYPAVVNNPPG